MPASYWEEPRFSWRMFSEIDLDDNAAHARVDRGGGVDDQAGRIQHSPARVAQAVHVELRSESQ